MPGTAASTSSKMPDRYVTKRIGAAGDPCGMPVSTGLASPVMPSSTSFSWRSDMKLPVHQMRSDSTPSACMRRPKCVLLTLLNAALTSMNRTPAIFFAAYACWVRFISTATASMQDRRLWQLN